MLGERDRVDVVVGEPDREEADRDQDDAEQRVDRARGSPACGPVLDREAQHEVGRVEEEEDEEEHELRSLHEPPDAPAGSSPRSSRSAASSRRRSRRGGSRRSTRGRSARAAPSTGAQRLPRAPAEARVRGQGDRDVEVEDLLREALVRVLGRVEATSATAAAIRRRGRERERLFRDDILKGSPADDRKDEVVEREEAQVAAAVRRHARADAADDDRQRERQEEERQEQLARPAATAIAASSVPTAQMPMSASATAGDRRQARPARRRSRTPGSAISSTTTRKVSTESVFASQIALRSHGREHEPVEQALLALRDERARRGRAAR